MTTFFSKKVLTSLTAAALATPGLASTDNQNRSALDAAADSNRDEQASVYSNIQSDLRFTRYQEDGPRYDINVWQAHFIIPFEQWEFTVDAQRDSQTGASVYAPSLGLLAGVAGAAPNELAAIRSGATISEDANSIDLKATYTSGEAKYGAGLYYWQESDTKSPGISFKGQWDFNKRNTRVFAGIGANYFKIKPSDSASDGISTRQKGDYWIHKYYAALQQDLSQYNFVQFSTEIQYQTGDLDDPYKYAGVTGDAQAYFRPSGNGVNFPVAFVPPALAAVIPDGYSIFLEKRPKHRTIIMPMIRFVQYVPPLDGALHLDYRFGADTWHIKSHTFEVKYFQPFGDGWEFAPLIRYYSQSQADFYGTQFNIGPNTPGVPTVPFKAKGHSNDYRLSNYGTLNLEARLSYQAFSNLKIGATAGWYKLKPGWTMSSKNKIENPAFPNKGFGAHYYGIDLRIKL